MAEDRGSSVLMRKTGADAPSAGGAPLTPGRALSHALERAAQDLMGLALRVTALREDRMGLAELPELLEERSLLAVIEGAGTALGLFALGPAAFPPLIEMQTMGRLSPAAPAPRRPTRTDAAMSAGFIDAVLAGLEAALAGQDAAAWAGGYRYASFLDDPRPLGLLLEDVGYRVFRADLAFGEEGARQAALVWAVPAAARKPALPHPGAPPRPGPAELAAQESWGRRMEHSVMGAQVTLDAVLHRVTLPLSSVLALRPGAEIALPAASIETIGLEGADRRVLSKGRLGQLRGQRALRLEAMTLSDGAEAPAAEHPGPPAAGAAPGSAARELKTTQPKFLAAQVQAPHGAEAALSSAAPVAEPARLRAGGA